MASKEKRKDNKFKEGSLDANQNKATFKKKRPLTDSGKSHEHTIKGSDTKKVNLLNELLIHAYIKKDINLIKELLERGADPNIRVNGVPLLIEAALRGYADVVAVLVDHKDIDVNAKDEEGKTALMRAAQKGHADVVKLLINRNDVDINARDENGVTALMFAAQKGHADVVKLLINRNDVERK